VRTTCLRLSSWGPELGQAARHRPGRIWWLGRPGVLHPSQTSCGHPGAVIAGLVWPWPWRWWAGACWRSACCWPPQAFLRLGVRASARCLTRKPGAGLVTSGARSLPPPLYQAVLICASVEPWRWAACCNLALLPPSFAVLGGQKQARGAGSESPSIPPYALQSRNRRDHFPRPALASELAPFEPDSISWLRWPGSRKAPRQTALVRGLAAPAGTKQQRSGPAG